MDEPTTRAQRRAATAAKILEAARAEFGEHGSKAATIRSIARRAGVDPSLVLQHYGSKEGLFALAVRPAPDLTADEVPQHLADVLDVRLRELDPATRALMRSMLTSPEAAAVMRAYLQDRIDDLAGAGSGEQAQLRAAIVVTSILGLTLARHLLDLPVLQQQGDRIPAITAPWFADLLGRPPV